MIAVCINEKQEILIAKRCDDKMVFPGKWEFGSSRLRRRLSVSTSLQSKYLEDFGIKIEEVADVPFNTYFNNTKGALGLLYIAQVTNNETKKTKIIPQRHDTFLWVSFDEAKSMGDDAFVPEALKNIELALEFSAQTNQSS